MERFLVFVHLSLAIILLGCQQNVRSQAQLVSPESTATINDSITLSRQTAITRAVETATPAIVSINVIELQQVRYRDPFADLFQDPFFGQFFSERQSRIIERRVQNLGSGFVISPDGYIVTNHHVAGNATKVTVSLTDGQTLDAELIGADKATDLALLKISPDRPLDYLRFSESPEPIVGEWAIALGNPFGLFEAAAPSVTVGVVSAAKRDLGSKDGRIYHDMIQTDAAINRGNSGGPLINALGEVIGVNAAIYSESGGSVGLGFAVPAARAQRIINELRETGRVDRSYYTGISFVAVTAQIAEALDLEDTRGILIADVDSGSPAEEAGLLPYDLIVGLQDESISNHDDYVARIFDFRPGDVITYHVLRDNRKVQLSLQIGRREG
ncbi:MAG: trypsin-like serine protease [Rhodothermaceae bacterium]|nr:trypsin-like serine protease [Rhodothermaceae bacterium]MXZ58778.1 trypsin-like serine protease [Rhodothermaceae bacterium]MYB92214.1 trypsin-like serine protease [Rhodothermaceae bacterium]MYD67281.1 trypsin-like serine protease [Rhodothermaceae bacterium]MYG44759.1 trypsin-like serine protease [Rhodothermaceae bacterium]